MYARRQQRYAMPRNKILSMLFHLFCIFFNGLFPCHFSFGLGLLARCPCSILLLVVSDSARFASNNTCNPRLASRSATWRATDHDGDGDGEDFSYQLVTLTCPIR